MRCSDPIHPPSPTLFRFPYQPTLCPRPTPTIKENLCYLNILRCVFFLLEHDQLIRGHAFRENRPFLSQELRTVSISWIRGGTSCPDSPSFLEFGVVQACTGLVVVSERFVSSYVQLPSCVQKTLLPFIHPLSLALTLCTLPQRLALGGGSVLCMPLYGLTLFSLFISAP